MRKQARQLALLLREGNGWGGRRDGAGRKPGAVRRDPHRKRAPLAVRLPCLVTLKVRGDVPSLRSGRFVREIERSLRQACERSEFRVAYYSILRNHFHAIVEAASATALSRGMKSLGSRLARGGRRSGWSARPEVASSR